MFPTGARPCVQPTRRGDAKQKPGVEPLVVPLRCPTVAAGYTEARAPAHGPLRALREAGGLTGSMD
jgi:hypothetical protein